MPLTQQAREDSACTADQTMPEAESATYANRKAGTFKTFKTFETFRQERKRQREMHREAALAPWPRALGHQHPSGKTPMRKDSKSCKNHENKHSCIRPSPCFLKRKVCLWSMNVHQPQKLCVLQLCPQSIMDPHSRIVRIHC